MTNGSPIPDTLDVIEERIRRLLEPTGDAIRVGTMTEYQRGERAGLLAAMHVVYDWRRELDEMSAEYDANNGPGVTWSAR